MGRARALVRWPRAAWRCLRILAHSLSGLFTIVWRFPRWTVAQREARVQAWAHGLLVHMGVRLQVLGAPAAAGPVLLVANHISWLDIPVLHAARYCRFVSKADVAAWPLIGTLATGAGTLYIERASRRDAVRVVHHMTESLRAGDVVAVFPEGTTGNGAGVLPFHANLLQAALSADAPIQPLALTYRDAATGEPSQAPAYVGSDTLVASLWRTLTADPLVAEVWMGTPQTDEGRDRRQWAADLRQTINDLRASP